jgi:hypothetical protein
MHLSAAFLVEAGGWEELLLEGNNWSLVGRPEQSFSRLCEAAFTEIVVNIVFLLLISKHHKTSICLIIFCKGQERTNRLTSD